MPKPKQSIEDYNVDVISSVDQLNEDAPDRLLEAFEALAVQGVVVHSAPDRIGARFFINGAPTAEKAIDQSMTLFREALEKAQIVGEFASVHLISGSEFERVLGQQPESYAGVTEVAGLLGVSRQRVSELRRSGTLPSPVAELAAGPVWRVSSLQRFIESWERRPGRPRGSAKPDTAS